jgi:hypothetical protein
MPRADMYSTDAIFDNIASINNVKLLIFFSILA